MHTSECLIMHLDVTPSGHTAHMPGGEVWLCTENSTWVGHHADWRKWQVMSGWQLLPIVFAPVIVEACGGMQTSTQICVLPNSSAEPHAGSAEISNRLKLAISMVFKNSLMFHIYRFALENQPSKARHVSTMPY